MCRTLVPRAPPFPASRPRASSVFHRRVVASFPLSNHHLRLLRHRHHHYHLRRRHRGGTRAASLPLPVESVAPTGSHVPINGVLLLVGRAGNNPLARFSISPSRATLPSRLLPIYPSACSFSPSFLPREKTRRVSPRRVDPIREGELFL